MTIGDRKYRLPSPVFPSGHYPEDTVVPTALRYGLENAYSLAQFGGRHLGTWVQDTNYEVGDLSGQEITSTPFRVASFKAYIPLHFDRLTAHVVWWNWVHPGVPSFRININTIAGAWNTPTSDSADYTDHVAGVPLREFIFSEDVPGGIAIPGTYLIELVAGEPTDASIISPFSVSIWGEVD